MPDGTRFRGRGLRRPLPAGEEQPDLGIYLSGTEPPRAVVPRDDAVELVRANYGAVMRSRRRSSVDSCARVGSST